MRKNVILGIVLASSFISFSTSAKIDSVNPEKTIQHLHYLYKKFTIDENSETVQLSGPKSKMRGYYDEEGRAIEISLDDYLKHLQISQSVFQATSGSGDGSGTAFLVGDNLVLSNQHVVETNAFEKKCGNFSIQTQIPIREDIACKKVHFCSPRNDYCLVEMENFSNGKKLSDLIQPLILKRNVISDSKLKTLIIGNAGGLGISAGRGIGISLEQVDNAIQLIHYTPTYSGSSGSPVMNLNGEVLGINFAGQVIPFQGFNIDELDGLRNFAVPSDIMISELRRNLPQEVFQKLEVNYPKYFNNNDLIQIFSELKNQLDEYDVSFDLNKKIKSLKRFREIEEIDMLELSGNYLQSMVEGLTITEKEKTFLKIMLSTEIKNSNILLTEIKNIFFANKSLYLISNEAVNDVLDICFTRKDFTSSCVLDATIRDEFHSKLSTLVQSKEVRDELFDSIINLTQKERFSSLYDTYAAREKIVNILIDNISPAKFIAGCATHQTEKLFFFSKYYCKEAWMKFLESNGFKGLEEHMFVLINLKLSETNYDLVEESFKKEVLEKPYFCFFGTQKCKLKKLKQIIEKWTYSNQLTKEEIKLLAEALVKND